MNIFKAIKAGNKAYVVEYINGNHDINIRDSYNMTPLIVATNEGKIDIVKLLIKSNADINSYDKIGQTALHLAAGRNHSEIIKVLIKAKAKSDIKAINGLTAYQYAAENGMNNAADLLKKINR